MSVQDWWPFPLRRLMRIEDKIDELRREVKALHEKLDRLMQALGGA